MIHLNIHEAKTQLSRYITRIMNGEVIILCKRNKPIAEIRPIASEIGLDEPRPIGLAKSEFTVTPEFFEPLPSEIIDMFEGKES